MTDDADRGEDEEAFQKWQEPLDARRPLGIRFFGVRTLPFEALTQPSDN